MALNGVCYECPICTQQGKKSLVRPLQISINDALIGCEDPECWYPFGIDSNSLLVRSSYKTLDPNKPSQVMPSTSLVYDNVGDGHSISTNICNDSILDEFQLDALLQDGSVQLDDEFCRDFNSFLNCENQESVQTDVTSVTTPQQQNNTGVPCIVSDNAPSLLNDLDWDPGYQAELPLPSNVSVIEDVHGIRTNVETLENQTTEISSDSSGKVEPDNSLISRDISERFIDSVRKQGNGGSSAPKPARSWIGKKLVTSPVKSGLADAMKFIDSDSLKNDRQTAKPKIKAKQVNTGRKKVVIKPNLDFHLC